MYVSSRGILTLPRQCCLGLVKTASSPHQYMIVACVRSHQTSRSLLIQAYMLLSLRQHRSRCHIQWCRRREDCKGLCANSLKWSLGLPRLVGLYTWPSGKQSCARVMTVESRVESRVIAFSRGRVPSRVAIHQSPIRVFASHCQSFSSHVLSHYSAVGRVNVTRSVLKILK